MSATQDALLDVYLQRWEHLASVLGAISRARRVSHPLLVDLDAHRYFEARAKLLVVGQQTYGWAGVWGDELGPSPVARLCREYRDFRLGIDYHRSPFWSAAHELYGLLNPDGPELGFAWSNLLKVDENGGRPGQDVEDGLLSQFNVLPIECSHAKPDIVVFFVGPRYDDLLLRTFPGSRLDPIEGHDRRTLVSVVTSGLPPHSYRTYHPKYLRLSGQWSVIAEIAARYRFAASIS